MSRTTPILPLALISLAAALMGTDRASARTEPAGSSTVDCSDAGEPVEYSDPAVLVGEAPVAWLTVDDGGQSTVTYDLEATAGLVVVEVAAEYGAAADVVITNDGSPFVELTGVPAGRQCLVDVEFAPGRYEWRVAGSEHDATFGVPLRPDCVDSPIGDPWATPTDGLLVVVEVGDDEVGVASGQALVAGPATVAVHAVDGTSDDAWVAIERDGDDFAVFADVPPGAVCSLDFDLPPGDYDVSTDLHGESISLTVWPVTVLDLTARDGGDAPVRLGLDEGSAASYTDACDVFTDDVILAAVPAALGAATVERDGPVAAPHGWQVSCEWLVVTDRSELVVELTLPGIAADAAGAAAFDETRDDAAAEPGFIDLGVIAERCYATSAVNVATARCPYGPSQVMVSVAGADATELVGAATTLLDNLWNRPAN